MRDPAAGLAALAGVLAPDGLMKLGFYSGRARASVNAGREIIASEGIGSSEADIRAFRQRVLREPANGALASLREWNDFYSTSSCRDLLFHVQEHQYALPQLEAMLRGAGLRVLSLSNLSPSVVRRYREMFPDDGDMTDLTRWDALEARYPDTFSGMFFFWGGR
jgi:hypothetical protein